MSRKQSSKKKGKAEKAEITITRDEADELQMIVDRLAVQNPEGESFEGYLNSLRNALAGRPHMAVALVEKFSKNPSPTGFRTFLALENIIANSPHIRHLKQAAYRFSQRGFVPEQKKSAPEKVVLIQGETRHPQCHFFLVQGTLWLVSALIPESGSGASSVLTAFLEDDYAFFNVKIAESTSRFYRDYLQKIAQHSGGFKPLEIPSWHAARLFFDMKDLWAPGGSPGAEVEHGSRMFKRFYDPDRQPYVYELMPAVDEPERHFSEIDFARLVEGMDLSWLRFAKNDVVQYHEKIKELDSPVLVVPREIQMERSQALVRSAADTLCAGKTRYLFQRFFEEQTMAFKLSGADEKANWAWTLARHFAGKAPAGENQAAFQLVMYSLKHYWPEEFKTPPPQPDQPPQERRTESGIILP
ncbi:MAG: hypothetical protein WAW37_19970 [Syntrophobacteraceae bacterium]